MAAPVTREHGANRPHIVESAGSSDPARSKFAACGDPAAVPIVARENLRLATGRIRRILVLKLDHLGDFIIGRPALQAIREAFPDDHIRLICGRWNLGVATASGFADEVRTYDYFPENASSWDGKPAQDVSVFDAAAEGTFDVAIDLRVDGDTRHLLERVDANIKCGVGSRLRFAFLDVILPAASKAPERREFDGKSNLTLTPAAFESRMRSKTPFLHETDERSVHKHLIYGPYIQLPRGRYKAAFGLRLHGLYAWPNGRIRVDVSRDNVEVAGAWVRRKDIADLAGDGPTLSFDVNEDISDDSVGRYEFRVHMSGWSPSGSLQFSGVHIEQIGALPSARYNRMELHVGEQLSLLVELLKQRITSPPPPPTTDPPSSEASALVSALPLGPRIVLAPLSNSMLRDWPIARYSELVGLLLEQTNAQIVLVGSRPQQDQLDQIVTAHHQNARILNLSGRTTWAEMSQVLRLADLVICNNSGIAHQAAALGAPTLAIFSASHEPQEWGPRGAQVRTLMAQVACSPCGHDRLRDCDQDHLCMRLITPQIVISHARAMLGDSLGAATTASSPAAMRAPP